MVLVKYQRDLVIALLLLTLYAFMRFGGVIVWEYDDMAIFLFTSWFAWIFASKNDSILSVEKCETKCGKDRLDYAYHMNTFNNYIDKVYVRPYDSVSWYCLDTIACCNGQKKISWDYTTYVNFIEHNQTVDDLKRTMITAIENKGLNREIDNRASDSMTNKVLVAMYVFLVGLLYGVIRFGGAEIIDMSPFYNAERTNIFEQKHEAYYTPSYYDMYGEEQDTIIDGDNEKEYYN